MLRVTQNFKNNRPCKSLSHYIKEQTNRCSLLIASLWVLLLTDVTAHLLLKTLYNEWCELHKSNCGPYEWTSVKVKSIQDFKPRRESAYMHIKWQFLSFQFNFFLHVLVPFSFQDFNQELIQACKGYLITAEPNTKLKNSILHITTSWIRIAFRLELVIIVQ